MFLLPEAVRETYAPFAGPHITSSSISRHEITTGQLQEEDSVSRSLPHTDILQPCHPPFTAATFSHHSDSNTPPADTELEAPVSHEKLAIYDKFFLELENMQLESCTPSSEAVQPDTEQVHSEQQRSCSSEREGNDDVLLQGQGDLSLSCASSSRPLLVIPTAPLVSDHSCAMMELIGGAPSLSVSDEEDKTEVRVESVLPFVETPAPQLFGHRCTSDPEPLYNRVPSVARSVSETNPGYVFVNLYVYDVFLYNFALCNTPSLKFRTVQKLLYMYV